MSALKFPECHSSQPLGGLSRMRFCAHPRVHAKNQLVTAEMCRICRLRTLPPPSTLRPAPPRRGPWPWQPACFVAESNGSDSHADGEAPRVVRGVTRIPAGERPTYECDVVIPYYRGLRWLPQTLEAVLAQNFVECHVHLINDHSPEDDTAIRRAFRGYRNLYWYRNQENIGPYRSYHQVWTRLKTDFFAIQDADDIPLPNRLWRALQALHETGAEIYGAAMEQMLSPETPTSRRTVRHYVCNLPITYSGVSGRYYPKGNLINGTMVCRCETFERLNGFAGGHHGACDVEFITRARYAGCRVCIDNSVVAIRRVHHTSLSRGSPHGVNSATRRTAVREWMRRYRLYEQATAEFDFAPFGALHEADPSRTMEVPHD